MLIDFFSVHKANQDSRRLFAVGHLFYLLRGYRCSVVMFAAPFKVQFCQPLQFAGKCRVCRQIGKLIRVCLQIKQHRSHFFHVYVLPAPVKNHH